MLVIVSNEKYKFELVKRVKNSPYEWNDQPSLMFKGRPANNVERKQYRLQKGVNGNTDSVFVICSNLPKEVDVGDKIIFLGKEWMVNSIGYYFDEAKFVNPGLMKDEYIAKKCPKGINIG